MPVRVQSTQRGGRARRWGYVTDSHGVLFVSKYVFHSEEAARQAGEADEAEFNAFHHQLTERNTI